MISSPSEVLQFFPTPGIFRATIKKYNPKTASLVSVHTVEGGFPGVQPGLSFNLAGRSCLQFPSELPCGILQSRETNQALVSNLGLWVQVLPLILTGNSLSLMEFCCVVFGFVLFCFSSTED